MVISNLTYKKRFLPGIRGCNEHQFRLWRALQDARSSQRNLCAIWLDLANAYGSVHHKLINFSLNHYHLPPKCKEIVQCIYRDLSVSIKSNSWQTCLIPFRKGVFQGDPLTVAAELGGQRGQLPLQLDDQQLRRNFGRKIFEFS